MVLNDSILKIKVQEIIGLLEKEYPNVKTSLRFNNPLELLIATILSAQCTDERVNEVTKKIFTKYRTPEDYAKSNLETFEQEIRPTGFYRNKAKNIRNTCKLLVENFHSQVPMTMKELISLPGVARKTANIVLSKAFGIIEGIAVDTHVLRISKRLGLTTSSTREKVEKDLMKIIPKRYWSIFTDLLIFHGRKICNARTPKCSKCVLIERCPSAFKIE